MKYLVILLLTCVIHTVIASTNFVPPSEAINKYPNLKLVFWDEFDTAIDVKNRWKHDITMGGGGNWEFSLYQNNRSTSYTENSNLIIHPRLITEAGVLDDNTIKNTVMDIWGTDIPSLCTGNQFYGCIRSAAPDGTSIINPILSAKLSTAESFSGKYFRFEARMKLPSGDWIWPAAWLLPRYQSYGGWPSSGEIDIMESRGNGVNYPPGGINKFGSTLHVGPYFSGNMWSKFHSTYTTPNVENTLADDFHIYGMNWTPEGITTYIDDPKNVVLSVKWDQNSMFSKGSFPGTANNPWATSSKPNSAPFDQEFYIIFNLAVGGTGDYFPDGVGNKPWGNKTPTAMKDFYNARNSWLPSWKQNGNRNSLFVIDYVRVWQDPNIPDSSASGKFIDNLVTTKRFLSDITSNIPSSTSLLNNRMNIAQEQEKPTHTEGLFSRLKRQLFGSTIASTGTTPGTGDPVANMDIMNEKRKEYQRLSLATKLLQERKRRLLLLDDTDYGMADDELYSIEDDALDYTDLLKFKLHKLHQHTHQKNENKVKLKLNLEIDANENTSNGNHDTKVANITK